MPFEICRTGALGLDPAPRRQRDDTKSKEAYPSAAQAPAAALAFAHLVRRAKPLTAPPPSGMLL